MRYLILILIFIGCDNSIGKSARIGNDALSILALQVVNVTKNTTTNTTTITNGNSVTVSTTTTGVDSGSSATNVTTTSSPLNDLQRFTLGDFKIYGHNSNYDGAKSYCESRGYKMITYEDFKLFVKLFNYVLANYSRVPNAWRDLYSVARLGEYSYWISDRDYLFSNDLAYAPKTKLGGGMDWRFEYINTNMGWVYNKTEYNNIYTLCYKLY